MHIIQREKVCVCVGGEKYHYACSNWKEKLAKVTCGFILKSQLAAGLQADVP